MSHASDTRTRASRLKLMAFDVDGVMTDGGLTYADDGSESKTFNVRDGLGLKLLQNRFAFLGARLGCFLSNALHDDIFEDNRSRRCSEPASSFADVMPKCESSTRSSANVGSGLAMVIKCDLHVPPPLQLR